MKVLLDTHILIWLILEEFKFKIKFKMLRFSS